MADVNGVALATDWAFAHPVVIYGGIIGILVILFIIGFIKKKFKKGSPKVDKIEVGSDLPVRKIREYKDTYTTAKIVPKAEEKPVVIKWQGEHKPIVIEEPDVEPEPEPEEEKEEYACENCPEARLHKKSNIFECPICHKFYCDWHLQPHINKKHRAQDYVVSSSDDGRATYKRG